MGKVVLDFDFELGMEKLAGKCGLPHEEFKKVLFDKDWIRPYERGEISTADYTGISAKPASFKWTSRISTNPGRPYSSRTFWSPNPFSRISASVTH